MEGIKGLESVWKELKMERKHRYFIILHNGKDFYIKLKKPSKKDRKHLAGKLGGKFKKKCAIAVIDDEQTKKIRCVLWCPDIASPFEKTLFAAHLKDVMQQMDGISERADQISNKEELMSVS